MECGWLTTGAGSGDGLIGTCELSPPAQKEGGRDSYYAIAHRQCFDNRESVGQVMESNRHRIDVWSAKIWGPSISGGLERSLTSLAAFNGPGLIGVVVDLTTTIKSAARWQKVDECSCYLPAWSVSDGGL